jgi:hypothetical protein
LARLGLQIGEHLVARRILLLDVLSLAVEASNRGLLFRRHALRANL